MFLVNFSAAWCGPCIKLQPVLAGLVEDQGAEIHYVDIDEMDREVLQDWGVSSVPSMFFMDELGELSRINGAVPAAKILEKLNA